MIPENELWQMYWGEEMTMLQIAKEVGVSQSTIENWMKSYRIVPRTYPEARLIGTRMIAKDELEKMYYDLMMSKLQIAKSVCVSYTAVGYWMKKYAIKPRMSFFGKDNPNWLGGISFEPYCHKFNKELKEAVRERDDYICQLCGYEQKLGGEKLSIHHIHYDKENCYPDVVALCRSCNSAVNSNRDYWEQYFENQLLERGLLGWSISA